MSFRLLWKVVNVTLLDYGAGNVPSVERALRKLGAQVEATNAPDKIASAHVAANVDSYPAWAIAPR